jgi:hypothetical protein
MIRAQLEAALEADFATRDRILRSLADRGKQSSEAYEQILEVLISDQTLSEVAATVIGEIGFPASKSAIPSLLYHVSNANSPAAPEALNVLRQIPASGIAPHAVEMLWDRGRSNKWWRKDVAGLAYALCQMGREYAQPCGPVIAYLLSDHELRHDLYVPALLRVIEVIGVESTAYALPVLLNLAGEGEETEVRSQARRLINLFDTAALLPYSLILPEPLQSPS